MALEQTSLRYQKTVRINNVLPLTCKITHKQLLCIVSSTSFTFIVEKHAFSLKNGSSICYFRRHTIVTDHY